jgi:hypothetical protein
MSDANEGAMPETATDAMSAEDVQAQELLADAIASEDDVQDPEGAESLGDPGKKALSAMKEQVRAEKARRKELENELRSLRNGAGQSSESVEDRVRAAVAEATARTYFETAVENAGLGLDESMMDFFKIDRFVKDGKADKAAINEFVGLFAPKKKKFAQGVGVGPQAASSGQLSRADLQKMSPAEIMQARKDGKLDALMRGQIG